MFIQMAGAPRFMRARNSKVWIPNNRRINKKLTKGRQVPRVSLWSSLILSDGRADAVTGIDALFPEQRVAWQAWLREFAIAGIFPRDGVKRGQTWKSTEVEESPSPIVRLEWQKSATYVRDEPCAPAQLSELDAASPKNPASETCAVVLTHAVLKQKSSPKDTTPEDFRLHDLRTTGTASGANETITYISLQTGLVVRVKEDARQFMDVVIAKTDGSNQVHYNVDAVRHTEILLLADARACGACKAMNLRASQKIAARGVR